LVGTVIAFRSPYASSQRFKREESLVKHKIMSGLTVSLLVGMLNAPAQAQLLGSAESFGVFGKASVTNAGPTVVRGNVGSSGVGISGFAPGVLANGAIRAGDPLAVQAQADIANAYLILAGEAFTQNLTGQDLGGMTLYPGVYRFNSSAFLTNKLTLDAQGDPNARFDFQIGSTLITASNSSVTLVNGARSNNVYFQVGSSATLGTGTTFAGNIVAMTSITLNTNARIINGRALARDGSVTMDANDVRAPSAIWRPIDLGVNRTDDTTRLLWKVDSINRYAVWKLSTTGAVQTGKYYGPISGYSCDQVAVAPNGQTTLLWKNPTTKQAALWTLDADLSSIVKATEYNYPAGYTPQNIAADQDSAIRISWRKTANNAIALWTINPASGAITGSATYGPYADLQDGPIAVGADGRIRLLWNNTQTGGAVLWTIPATYGAPSSGFNYNPVPGAVASDIAVGADNKTRLQWSYTTGANVNKIAVWKINTAVDGTGAIEVGKFYGPIVDVFPLGLSVGGDNQTRKLWKYDETGKTALWVLSDPLTSISAAYTYGPL